MIKMIKRVALILGASMLAVAAGAQEKCDIDIATVDITQGDFVPAAVSSRLQSKLMTAMSKAGLTSVPYDSRFFVAGRFDDALNDVTGGPSPKTIVKTTLTIYIGDAEDKKVFASETFDLKGVGGNDQQAYSNALNSISGSNRKLIEFLASGKDKIIEYFDANYQTYIQKAKKAMADRNYDEALYYSTLVPSCCKGYAEASALSMRIYSDRMEYDSKQLLAQARAAWAADPTASGAEKAYSFLSQIDPAASCAAEAKALGDQISKTTQKQWEFENVTKYKDQLELEKKRIDSHAALERERLQAAKAVAVAYAKSRPTVVNRYVFLR